MCSEELTSLIPYPIMSHVHYSITFKFTERERDDFATHLCADQLVHGKTFRFICFLSSNNRFTFVKLDKNKQTDLFLEGFRDVN